MTYDAWLPIETTRESAEPVFVLMRDGAIFEARPERVDDYFVWFTEDGILRRGDEDPIGWLPRDALPRS